MASLITVVSIICVAVLHSTSILVTANEQLFVALPPRTHISQRHSTRSKTHTSNDTLVAKALLRKLKFFTRKFKSAPVNKEDKFRRELKDMTYFEVGPAYFYDQMMEYDPYSMLFPYPNPNAMHYKSQVTPMYEAPVMLMNPYGWRQASTPEWSIYNDVQQNIVKQKEGNRNLNVQFDNRQHLMQSDELYVGNGSPWVDSSGSIEGSHPAEYQSPISYFGRADGANHSDALYRMKYANKGKQQTSTSPVLICHNCAQAFGTNEQVYLDSNLNPHLSEWEKLQFAKMFGFVPLGANRSDGDELGRVVDKLKSINSNSGGVQNTSQYQNNRAIAQLYDQHNTNPRESLFKPPKITEHFTVPVEDKLKFEHKGNKLNSANHIEMVGQGEYGTKGLVQDEPVEKPPRIFRKKLKGKRTKQTTSTSTTTTTTTTTGRPISSHLVTASMAVATPPSTAVYTSQPSLSDYFPKVLGRKDIRRTTPPPVIESELTSMDISKVGWTPSSPPTKPNDVSNGRSASDAYKNRTQSRNGKAKHDARANMESIAIIDFNLDSPNHKTNANEQGLTGVPFDDERNQRSEARYYHYQFSHQQHTTNHNQQQPKTRPYVSGQRGHRRKNQRSRNLLSKNDGDRMVNRPIVNYRHKSVNTGDNIKAASTNNHHYAHYSANPTASGPDSSGNGASVGSIGKWRMRPMTNKATMSYQKDYSLPSGNEKSIRTGSHNTNKKTNNTIIGIDNRLNQQISTTVSSITQEDLLESISLFVRQQRMSTSTNNGSGNGTNPKSH